MPVTSVVAFDSADYSELSDSNEDSQGLIIRSLATGMVYHLHSKAVLAAQKNHRLHSQLGNGCRG